MISIVVAYAANRAIGRDGQLPWRLPGDMRRFRELTSGHCVVMGRRTYESLPDAFRPLPGRRNLVLSRNPAYAPAGAEVLPDLDSAVVACGGECFVVGGAAVYAEALPVVERIYATEIGQEVEGDTFFAELERGAWRAGERSEQMKEDGLSYSFVVYERVAGGGEGAPVDTAEVDASGEGGAAGGDGGECE